MKRNCRNLATLGLTGLAVGMSWTAQAQDEPQTSRPTPQVTRPNDGAPTPPTGSASAPLTLQVAQADDSRIYPSTQSPAISNPAMGRAAIAQLANPFERRGLPDKRGLFSRISPQPSAQYPGPPPTLLGESAEPGMTPARVVQCPERRPHPVQVLRLRHHRQRRLSLRLWAETRSRQRRQREGPVRDSVEDLVPPRLPFP